MGACFIFAIKSKVHISHNYYKFPNSKLQNMSVYSIHNKSATCDNSSFFIRNDTPSWFKHLSRNRLKMLLLQKVFGYCKNRFGAFSCTPLSDCNLSKFFCVRKYVNITLTALLQTAVFLFQAMVILSVSIADLGSRIVHNGGTSSCTP